MGKFIDLTGKTFYQLTVLEHLGVRNKKHYWKCQCTCGNIVELPGDRIRSGNTKSCGCRKYIGLKQYNDMQSELNKIPNGTRFGKLTVVEDVGYIPHVQGHNRRGYRCLCDCGNEIIVSGNQLKGKNVQTCGHCESSIGEMNIYNLLTSHKVKFEHDKSLSALTDFTGKRLRFDFIVYDKDDKITRIIEFDGRQHINGPDTDYWGHITETLSTIQEKDQLKNDFCKKNNIPLVRIPYTRRDNITYEEIFSDKYLI